MPESLWTMVNTVLDIYGPALPVGLIIAAVGAVFGVFVVLKRVVFIGVTLSEAAACGIALGLLLGWPPFVGALLTALVVVALLGLPFERWLRLPRDTLLGVLFVAFSAGSIVLVSQSGFGLEKVKALLFGSLLFASRTDLLLITAVLVPCALWLLLSLRPTTYAFLDPDAAAVLGIPVKTLELAFFVALGAVVAAAAKIAGVLLIFCYLVVAPGVALLLHHRLRGVLVLAVVAAWLSTIGGILLSYRFDLPPNQTVGLVHCLLFGAAVVGRSGLPMVGWAHGLPFSLLSSTIIVIALLVLPGAMSTGAPTMVDSGNAEVVCGRSDNASGACVFATVASAATSPATLDWSARTQELCDRIARERQHGVRPAFAFLAEDPPLLFRARVVAALDAVLPMPCGWHVRAPAGDPRNQEVCRRCLAALAADPTAITPCEGGRGNVATP